MVVKKIKKMYEKFIVWIILPKWLYRIIFPKNKYSNKKDR